MLIQVDDKVLLRLELGRQLLGADVLHRPLLVDGRWFAVHIFFVVIIVQKLGLDFA